MNIPLPPETEQYINEKVASGDFESAQQVITEGIRLLRQEENWRQEARVMIDEGLAAAKAGRLYTPEQVKENLARFKSEWLADRSA
jgi:antitoxin ParD1/3/4